MIAPAKTASEELAMSETTACEGVPELEERRPDFLVLARYGRVPQVARFSGFGDAIERSANVVVTTDRGTEVAEVLQCLPIKPTGSIPEGITGEIQRLATAEDLNKTAELQQRCESGFSIWIEKVAGWKLQLELIDSEYTLDERLILYVLNDRGAETTRLALLAAAAGFGVIHVQPVSAEGVVQSSGGGGCGSCSNHH